MTWKDVSPALKSITKKLGITPENPFSEHPGLFGSVVSKYRSYKGPAEGILHEIGHLLLLGLLHPDGTPRPNLKRDASEQIEEILRRRDVKISDDHEVYVLAIEKRFAKKIGLKLSTSSLVGYAFMGFRYYQQETHYQRLIERVNKLSKTSKTIAKHSRRLIRMVKSEMVSLKSPT